MGVLSYSCFVFLGGDRLEGKVGFAGGEVVGSGLVLYFGRLVLGVGLVGFKDSGVFRIMFVWSF